MAPGIAAMLVVVGLAAIATAIKTRQERAPWASTLAALAAAVGVLAWVLLDALGLDVSLIAYVIAPFLLAVPVLFLVGKRDFAVPIEQLREIVARWFFMAALTGRYSSSPESQIESDLARLRGASDVATFTRALDEVVDDTLTADYWQITLPNALATSAARSPSLYAYYAALNLLDARVLLSRMRVNELLDPALKSKRAALERHHLFPKGYLRSIGIEAQPEVNQIASYAFVEWPKNTAISDEPPATYWPRFTRAFDGDELERMCFWHALPERRHEMPYADFLAARRRLIADVVRAGFVRLTERTHPAQTTAGRW